MVLGVKITRTLMDMPALKRHRHPRYGKKLFSAHAVSDDEIRAQIRLRSDTCFHPVGTCRMGPDATHGDVVDADLRVHGVRGLRVVDASVMPRLVSGDTNAPVIAIAEKAADLIRAAA